MTGNSHSLISRQSAKIQQLKNGEQSHDLIMKHIFGTDLNVYYFNNFPSLDNFISIKLPSLAKKKKKRGNSEHQRSKPTEQTRKLRDGLVHVWKLNI